MTDTPSSDPPPDENPYDPAGETTEAKPPKPRPPQYRPLRIWPAVVLVVLMWGLRIVPGLQGEMTMGVMMAAFMGPLACGGLIVLWWLFFSRARWTERLLGLLGLAAIVTVTTMLADKSIAGFGTMIYAAPWGMTAFAAVLAGLAHRVGSSRTWCALLAALLAFGFWDLVRTDAIRGDFRTTRSWRWEQTAEDRYVESLTSRGSADSQTSGELGPLAEPEWSEFRGPNRDSVQPGVVLAEDWQAQPPRVLWRVEVGPGWSSFSVAGKRLFTQEQRGDEEAIVCLHADTGEQIWAHQYESRFWEVVGGAGPRGTPTLSGGALYALGANGILHRLDPESGEQVWRRDIRQDANREPPEWGFSSSPLVTCGLVIVHAGGKYDKGVLAYDAETGDLRWGAPAGDHTYSSPHLATIDGKQCVMMLGNDGLVIVDPADGILLGQHEWKFEGYRVVQPLMIEESSVLLGTPMGMGSQRLKLRWEGQQFSITETWMERSMSPYYNDYVAHQGNLYGFDNNIFASVDLASGKRNWKRGRYGNGQVLLLPDGDQLLIISEDGELVLLRATPDKHTELARFRVLDGRTWNHPVLVGNRLYVRNAEEAACFEMPVVSTDSPGEQEESTNVRARL